MDQSTVDKIQQMEAFQKLTKARSSYNWTMAIIMMAVYFAFILFIAFNPSALATKVATESVISIGILGGFGLIVFSFILTGIYVRRANSEFDGLSNKVKELAK
ncbi:MAG: DUF485 domain-containing protein [Gammaproteobacteria bacterium]|nr:DUF485 domain-containing protein [Gammaproteobacteria bacterium]